MYEKIKQTTIYKAVKILIATKSDLVHQKNISLNEAEEFVNNNDFYCPPIVTSVKTGKNVEKVFQKIVEGITSIYS